MRYKLFQTCYTECKAEDELHQPYLDQSAYQAFVPERGRFDHSQPINIDTVVVNNSDGIILGVNPASDTPLENALYTILNRVDALELCAVHYVRNDNTGNVLKLFKGHRFMLAVRSCETSMQDSLMSKTSLNAGSI